MDKYKIISFVLAFALLVSLVRVVYVSKSQTEAAAPNPTQIVLDNIFNRKSVRAYTDAKVSREQLDTLVRAAMAAPTGRDMRPWKFIIVDEKEVLDSLSAKLPRAKMLKDASAAIVVCGDLSITDSEGNPSGNWTFDCSAATENLLLTAEAMGLGAVWTGAYPYEDRQAAVKQALELPEHIIPLNVIPIGYPKGNPQPKDKFDENNIHYNGW